MKPPLYEINALKHAYSDKTVLSVEHMTVQPASIVGLIGPNGSGKSTLLKLLGMIEKPSQGKIYFYGRSIEPFSDEARFQITMLPQEPFLMKRNVFNNVSYGLKLRKNGGNIVARVNEALSLVGLTASDFTRRPWYALSGGETQRVALAARLALAPKVLLLDEPTASVDAATAQLIKEASLQARQQLGTTLIVASHDWQWLYEVCDEVMHLFKGRVFGTGRESIIFGPWQKLGSDRWGKILNDGQLLLVPAPPGQGMAAVVDVLSIGEEGAQSAKETVLLKGTVSRLSLERKTGQLFATVLVGGLPFTARLSRQQSQAHAVFPGDTLSLRYQLEQVKWI